MLSLAEQAADTPMQISALTHLASVLALRMGQFQEADELLFTADRMARAYDGKTGIPEMAILRCQMCTAMADFDSVVKHMGEVVALGPELKVKEYQSMAMEHVAGSLMFLTRFDEALQRAEEGLVVARQIGDREHEAALLTQSIPMSLAARGELDEARQAAEQGLEIAGRIGSIISLVYGNWLLGEIARWRGEYETALLYGSRSMEAALPVEELMPFITVQPLGSLGTTYLEISGHFSEQVARFHRHALQILENPGGQAGGGTAWADLGFCAMAVGDLEAAEVSFQKGLNHPSMFMLVERPRHLAGMALIELRRGRTSEASRYVAEAQAYAGERNMKSLEPLLAFVSGQILAAQGATGPALEALERAEVLGLQMNLRPIVWQARLASAEALEAAGLTVEGAGERAAARAIVEEMAALFADPTLQEAFLSHTLPRVAG
jgi:tetratricopeptide (TPR) repeat protein